MGDSSITARKKYEDTKSNLIKDTVEFTELRLKAEWVNKTDAKVKQVHVQERYEQFLREHQEQLENRRKR